MAIGSGGPLGTAASGSSGSTLALTLSSSLEAGNVGLLSIACDNTNTTDGTFNEVTSVTDTGLNTYTKLGEYTNGQGGAQAGVTCSLWYVRPASNLNTGATITINFSSSIVDKCATFYEFTVGNPLVESATEVNNATDGSNGYGSVSHSGLSSVQRLYFRALAKEANTTTNITPSTNFTAVTNTRSRNNANAVTIHGEFRINTSTGETSDPTLAVSGDTAAVFVALAENAPATYTGTSALTIAAITLAATSTFRTLHTGTSALAITAITLSASAQHVTPPVTATSSLLITAITLEAVAEHDTPVYSASSSLTITAITLEAVAEHDTPVYTATADLTITSITLSAHAEQPRPAGPITQPASGIARQRYGDFTKPEIYTASSSLVISSITLDAVAEHDTPVYSATSSLLITPITLSASAQHVTPTYSATSSLLITPITLSASAQHTPPIYSATSSLLISSITLNATASNTAPVYSATSSLLITPITLSAPAIFIKPVYSGSAALQISQMILEAYGLTTGPPISGLLFARRLMFTKKL